MNEILLQKSLESSGSVTIASKPPESSNSVTIASTVLTVSDAKPLGHVVNDDELAVQHIVMESLSKAVDKSDSDTDEVIPEKKNRGAKEGIIYYYLLFLIYYLFFVVRDNTSTS